MRKIISVLRSVLPVLGAMLVLFPLTAIAGSGMGTAFIYRGQLAVSGAPYTGSCDFQFGLWDSSTAGAQVGSTQSNPNVTVAGGVFDVSLDFGASAFDGSARWLETAVRCPAGSGSYTTLAPRQALTPMPYALYALRVDAANVNGLSAGTGLTYSGGQFSIGPGALTNGLLANSAVTVTAGAGLSGGGAANLGGATSLSIADGGVTDSMLAGAISNAHLANSSVTVTAGGGLAGGGAVNLGGSVPLSVAANGITTAMLADNAIVAGKVDPASVQLRVTGACPAGQAVQSISADGTVTCGSSGAAAYYARVQRAAAQTISAGTWTAIAWDTEKADTDSMWTGSAPTRITVQHPGVYALSANVSLGATNTNLNIRLDVNGAVIAATSSVGVAGQAVNGSTTSAILYLNAADYVTASVFQASGGNLNTAGSTYLSVAYLGP